MKVMKEILTTSFFSYLQAAFEAVYGATEPVCEFLDYYKDDLHLIVEIDFDDMPALSFVDDKTDVELAQTAFMKMGDAYKHIFDALTAEYDPLENFFTNATYGTSGNNRLSKTGTEKTTPSGTTKVTRKGQMYVTADGGDMVGQGTTYDSATTNSASSTDFYNLNKTISNAKEHQYFGDSAGNNNPTTETTYENYKVEKSFESRTDSTLYGETKTENKRGNSGIFSKQDLTQREIRLRIKNRLLPIYVRMVTDVFSTGVWNNDN